MIGLKEPLQKGHFGSQTGPQFRVFHLLSQGRFWAFRERAWEPDNCSRAQKCGTLVLKVLDD